MSILCITNIYGDMHLSLSIYIYIYRERERERSGTIYIYIYICIYVSCYNTITSSNERPPCTRSTSTLYNDLNYINIT